MCVLIYKIHLDEKITFFGSYGDIITASAVAILVVYANVAYLF